MRDSPKTITTFSLPRNVFPIIDIPIVLLGIKGCLADFIRWARGICWTLCLGHWCKNTGAGFKRNKSVRAILSLRKHASERNSQVGNFLFLFLPCPFGAEAEMHRSHYVPQRHSRSIDGQGQTWYKLHVRESVTIIVNDLWCSCSHRIDFPMGVRMYASTIGQNINTPTLQYGGCFLHGSQCAGIMGRDVEGNENDTTTPLLLLYDLV